MSPKKDANQNKQQIGNLLARYREVLKPPQASVEKEFIQVVEDITGFTLDRKQVHYSVGTKTISLTLPSVLKTELKQRQSAIIAELQKRLPAASVPTVVL